MRRATGRWRESWRALLSRLGSRCNGTSGVLDPAAERSDIEAGGGQSGELDRQRVVAGGDAAAAGDDDVAAVPGVELPPLFWRPESLRGREVRGKRGGQGARDVSGFPVGRLPLAAG